MATQELNPTAQVVDESALQPTGGIPTRAPSIKQAAITDEQRRATPFPVSEDVATVSPAVQTSTIGKDTVAQMQKTLDEAQAEALKLQEGVKQLQAREAEDKKVADQAAIDQENKDRELGIKEAALDLETADIKEEETVQSQLLLDLDKNYADLQSTISNIESGTSFTPAEQSAINSLKADFDRIRGEQGVINENFEQGTRIVGARAGRQEFATNRYMSDVQEAVNLGQSKLRDIDVSKTKAVNELKMAFQTKQYDQAFKAYETLNDLTTAKATIVADMQEATAKTADAAAKQAADEQKEWNDQKSGFLDTAVEAGAPVEVSFAISEAKNMAEVLLAGGDWLQRASGIVGEYNFYKRQTENLGQTPLSFDEYQTRDANRKRPVVNVGAQGMPNNVVSQIDKISASFDSAPITKQYNEVLNKKISVDSILDAGVGGPGDLALVFEFMKALDPTSVVRESEYAAAAESGNIFKGWAAKFNGYMSAQGGFLPENVKDSFQTIINTKLGAIESQYTNLRNEKGRLIEKKSDKYEDSPGVDYLIDYGSAAGLTENIQADEETAQNSVVDYALDNPEMSDSINGMIDDGTSYIEIQAWLNQSQ